ncbi:MAG: tyrosine-type recombinase/integrase [Candidatus Magasanikbacteria bacterium]|jgi:site-specific recombinase XerD|nr:tyrosine-type recombinase/integrase [Anaerolineae bacterium]MBT6819121.1 tyrosine-type recombinase/integrase [Candidatus Magasanikbacteria bacterium]
MKTKEAIDVFLEAKIGVRASTTIQWHKGNLQRFSSFIGENQRVESIDIRQLRQWRAELTQRDLSAWTIHGYLRTIRHFFRWLEEEEMLSKNPAKRLKLFRLPKPLKKGIPDADRDAMLSVRENNIRDFSILMFVATTGCRIAGVTTLTIDNLDLDCMAALITEKGEKSRTVFFDPMVANALKNWLNVRPSTNAKEVFVQKEGKGLTSSGIYQVFKRAAKDAGVKKNWNPHQWRHAFARNFLRNGGDIGILSQILGHASIHVTLLHYGGLENKDLQRAHLQYAPKVA